MAGAVALEAAVAVAQIGPETSLPAMQVGFLVTASGMLLYAGRIVGQWQAAQKALIGQVDKINRSNLELRTRVAKLEGQLGSHHGQDT